MTSYNWKETIHLFGNKFFPTTIPMTKVIHLLGYIFGTILM